MIETTPQLTHEQTTQIAQEHEDFLNQLESLAISAIASGNWWPVYDLISEVETWQGEQALLQEKSQIEDSLAQLWEISFSSKASTDSLVPSGADSCSSPNDLLVKD
jgi:hypothetical protein